MAKQPKMFNGTLPKKLTKGLRRHLAKVFRQNPEHAILQVALVTGNELSKDDTAKLLRVKSK